MTDAQPRAWRRILLRGSGLALLALCLIYLVKALTELDFGRLLDVLGTREWLLTGVASVVYAGTLALLAKAWAVVAAGGHKLSTMRTVALYGPGVVTKYFPGSVLQYASRHVMGRREGLAHGPMARASVIEAALHVGVALTLAATLIGGAGPWVPAGGTFVAAVLLARVRRPLLVAFACQVLFFCAFAAIIIALASFGGMTQDPARLAGLFFIAWTAGLLVPIAPGGIGVREAVLLALAAPYETTDAIVLLGLLSRVVGIVGDGLFGLAGYFASMRVARENRQASA